MEWMQIIEIVAATIGLIYVWLELKASMWLWPVGIVLPLFWIYISWHSEVYGNVLVNIYYIIACIWGWREWLRHQKVGTTEAERPITFINKRSLEVLIILAVALTLLLAPAYDRFMGSPFPYWDGVATAVSFIGMWLLAKKYMENWYCWILSNLIYSILYFVQGFTISGVFFTIYTAIAIAGYFNWRRLMRTQEL